MEETNLPNILLLSDEVPQSVNAGAILLLRLLKDYPSDKLLVIGGKPDKNADILHCRYEVYRPTFERLLTTRFDRVARSLRTYDLLPENRINPLLKGFKPDVVLSVMQSQAYFIQAYTYAKSEGLPLVLIVHDDPEIFGRVYSIAKNKKKEVNKRIYNYASKRLCISPEMVQYLKSLYDAEGDVLYPNPSELIKPRPLEESLALKNAPYLTVGYAGSLAYGYGQRLEQMLPAFKKAGAKLNIYSYTKKSWFDKDVVNYRGGAIQPEETWEKVKQECDAVVLPYSFEDYPEHKLYHTHFPSKLPEYLSLQMPVIISGPEHATGVKWGKSEKNASLVVAKPDERNLVEILVLLKNSKELRHKLAENALQAKNNWFNPGIIREQFYKFLSEASCKKQEYDLLIK